MNIFCLKISLIESRRLGMQKAWRLRISSAGRNLKYYVIPAGHGTLFDLMDTSDMSSEERFIKLSAIKCTSRVYQSVIPYLSRDFL